MFDAERIRNRADDLLGKPRGHMLNRLCYLGFEWPAKEWGNPPTHLDVVVTFEGELPTVAELVAVGRAVVEAHPDCRVIHAHPDAGVVCHQIGVNFMFPGAALVNMDVLPIDPATLNEKRVRDFRTSQPQGAA